MGFIANVKQINYRLKMRKALQMSSIEELHVALEETKREIERRNRKNGKNRK